MAMATAMFDPEGKTRAGYFTLPTGKVVFGELTLGGPKTSLHLHDKDYFDIRLTPDQYIKGSLLDLTKVSLIHCNSHGMCGSGSRGEERYHFADIFPHYVAYGDHHLRPNENSVAEINFEIDDAATLFHDYHAFGYVLDAKPYIKKIANANYHIHGRRTRTGPDPEILFFAGKRKICVANTCLGKISVSNYPVHNFGNSKGIQLKNSIVVTIQFAKPINFYEAISRVFPVLKFLEILVGRPQNILSTKVKIKSRSPRPAHLHVYWSMAPHRETRVDEREPHTIDILIDAAENPNIFSRVLRNWLLRHTKWRDARSRFFSAFANQDIYTADRLIAAANAFDIIPSSAFPRRVTVSENLESARDASRKLFLALPTGPERDSVLSILGRIGKSTLKQKIRHRAQVVTDKIGDRLPDLAQVTDEAVNCRNHYVHGSKGSFGYNTNLPLFFFLIGTLEFVFAASDLIDAGWNPVKWLKRGSTLAHPFSQYMYGYKENLRMLKRNLK